nr:hypothetical protein [Tanacetum cinerariifolium]
MGDANPISTLRDYSRPSHEGYRNTIELLERNNVVPLQSDTIRLVQNRCSFHIEYLVKISKKTRILELKQRYLKITILTSNMPYPSRKIQCICACTSLKTTKEQGLIRRIQSNSIRRIQVIVIKYSRRYRTWSLLQETFDTRKLLKTLSLDESRSPEFNLFSDLEEYSEEEVVETMAKTMQQYMIKTRADYGSGIASSDHEDANEHTEKVLEIVNFYIPNITQDQEDLKIKFLSKYCPPVRTAKKMEEVILFYNGLDVPTRQIIDLKGVIPSKTVADAKVTIQEMVKYSQKCHNGTSRTRSTKTFDGLATKRQEENSNMIKEIRASTDAVVRNQGASIKTLEIQIGKISKKEKDPRSFTLPCYISNVCFDNDIANLGASVSVMPLSTYLTLGLGELAHSKLTVELADRTVKYPKGIAENVLVGIGKFVFPIDFIILDMTEDVKVPLILERPFLSTAHAKIDVFKRKITLRVGDEKIIFKSVKPASSLIKRVYMLSLREIMELDLEARLMGETLVLNRSLDLLYEDYIKLNDLNVSLVLRRNQVDDLLHTIEEGKGVLQFYKKGKVEYKGKNVVEAFMNVPIFIGKFSVETHFVVAKNMDGYRDKDMGDIILGESFCKASCVEARRLITIHNDSDNVTYQMA